MEAKEGEEEKEKLVEMLYSLIKDDSDEDNKKECEKPLGESPILDRKSRSNSYSSRSRSSSKSSIRSSRSSSSRSARSSSTSSSRSSRSRSGEKSLSMHSSENNIKTNKDDQGDGDSQSNEFTKSVVSNENEVMNNVEKEDHSQENDKSRTPSPVELDMPGILEACTPHSSSNSENEAITSLPPTKQFDIRLPNFKYKSHHVHHPANADFGLHPVFSVHHLSKSHPTFCPKSSIETESTDSETEIDSRVEITKRKSGKSKKSSKSASSTGIHKDSSYQSSSNESNCENKIGKSRNKLKKSKKPKIAAATRKSGLSSSAKTRVSTAFTSSEESEGIGDEKKCKELKELVSGERTEVEEGEEEISDAEKKPVVKKVDVSMERLHKNIVEHKYGQYNKWLEREKQLKLLKDEEERREKKREELRLAKEVEDQRLALKEEKRIAKMQEKRLSTDKDQRLDKKLEEESLKSNEKAITITDENGGSEASIDSDEEVEVQKKKAKKKSKNQLKEISDHRSSNKSSPKYTESKTSNIDGTMDAKDASPEKTTAPSKPQVFANPFFDSSSSSEDEKDKEQLVEMLYSLISDEKQNEADSTDRKRERASKCDDDDSSSPAPAVSESEKDFVAPTVLEELPSKSAFDNLLGASSDVTVEALEDTLDTSELEATFVADSVADNENTLHPEVEKDKNADSEDVMQQNSVDVLLLKKETKFKEFITVLELECAECLKDRRVVDISELERMVQRALESLESKQLRDNHLEEDKRFLSQHGLREVQVSVRNVSLQNYFEEEHKKVVTWFKEEVGDKVTRKQKLLDGMSFVRERYLPVLPFESKEDKNEVVKESDMCMTEDTGDKHEDNIKSSSRKKRVLDSSDSEVELGKAQEEQEKSSKLVEDVSEKLEKSAYINEDNKKVEKKHSNSNSNSCSSGKDEDQAKSSKSVTAVKEGERVNTNEDIEQAGKKHSNSSSNGKDNREVVYRPGPVKSKRKSHEKEKSKTKNQKDKRWLEEKRMEKHHSQGFKIPRVSSTSGTEATDKVAVETEMVSKTPSSVEKQNVGDGYQQAKKKGEKINLKEKKLERRTSMDKVGPGEAKATNVGDMKKTNKLYKETKPRESNLGDVETINLKKVEREKLKKEEKGRRDKKSGREKSGEVPEERQSPRTSESKSEDDSDFEDDLPAPVPAADLDELDDEMPEPVPACAEDDSLADIGDDGGCQDDDLDNITSDVDMPTNSFFTDADTSPRSRTLPPVQSDTEDKLLRAKDTVLKAKEKVPKNVSQVNNKVLKAKDKAPDFTVFPPPVPSAPRRRLLGPPPPPRVSSMTSSSKPPLLGLPPGPPPLSVPPPVMVPPPPVWTPGLEPLRGSTNRRESLLGSPPKMFRQAGQASESEGGPRRGPSTPVGEEPDTQSEGSVRGDDCDMGDIGTAGTDTPDFPRRKNGERLRNLERIKEPDRPKESDRDRMRREEKERRERMKAGKEAWPGSVSEELPNFEAPNEKVVKVNEACKKVLKFEESNEKNQKLNESRERVVSEPSTEKVPLKSALKKSRVPDSVESSRDSSYERSRTPSPFLSANRHYPWLYEDQEEPDTGIQLDKIRIKEKKTNKKSREERKQEKEERLKVQAKEALNAVRSQNEEYEPADSEDGPLWEPSSEELKLQPPKMKEFKIDETKSFLGSAKVQDKKKAESNSIAGPQLGNFFDKVISSLQTKKQETSLPSRAPLPPLPPGPPVPPPPPSEPPPLPPEPSQDTPDPGQYPETPTKISLKFNESEYSLVPPEASNDNREDERLRKAKEKLALIKKNPKQSPVNGLKRQALLPNPNMHEVNDFLSDWGVEGGMSDRHWSNGRGGGKRSASNDWSSRQSKRFGGEAEYQSSYSRRVWEQGDGHQGQWDKGVRHSLGGNYVGDEPHSVLDLKGSGMSVERMWMEKFLAIWRKLLDSQWTVLRGEVDREVQSKKQSLFKSQDLGSKYNEPTLNQRVVDKMLGEERAVFKCWENQGITQLECTVCNIIVNGMKTMQGHMQGRKHLNRLEDFTVIDGVSDCDPVKATVDLVPERSLLSRLLEKYNVGPLVGLEYVVEVLVGRSDPEYKCALCRISSNILFIMEHLLSANHRLAYMDKFFPQASRKFLTVPNKSLWTHSTYDFLDTVVTRIEAKFARAKPRVVASLVVWEKEKSKIAEEIEQGAHAKECPGFTFENLPDPFYGGNFVQSDSVPNVRT